MFARIHVGRLALAALAFAGVARAEFVVLPTTIGSIQDLSDDGEIVVGYTELSASRAFRWSRSIGYQDLGTLGGSIGAAYRTSSDGAVVFGFTQNANQEDRAFRWTPAGMTSLGEVRAYVQDCSSNGTRVVGWHFNVADDRKTAFWKATQGALRDLGTLGGLFSEAQVCSANGNVVYGWADDAQGRRRFFRWTPERGMQSLGGNGPSCAACSDDGAVAVGVSTIGGISRPVRWTKETGIKHLGSIGGDIGQASHCSADGSVIAGYAYIDGSRFRAFRWTPSGRMKSLGALGLTYSFAQSMSSAGDVVGGAAYDQPERYEAFLWRKGIGTRTAKSVLDAAFGNRTAGWEFENVLAISDDGRTIVVVGEDPSGLRRFAWARLPRTKNVSESRGATPGAASAVAWAMSEATIRLELDPEDRRAQAAYVCALSAYYEDASARFAAADVDDAGEAYGAFYSARTRCYVASVYAAAYGDGLSGDAAKLLKYDLEN